MTQSLTDWLRQSRLMVVEVHAQTGRLRVRGEAEACSDIACSEATVVVADDEGPVTLHTLNPGDIVIDIQNAAPARVTSRLRRAGGGRRRGSSR